MFVIYNAETRMYLHRHNDKGWTLMVDDASLYASQQSALNQMKTKMRRMKKQMRYISDSRFDNYPGSTEAREACGKKIEELESAVVREVRIVPVEMKES